MMTHIVPAIRMLILMSILTGALYPLAVTGIAQLLFPSAANGTLILRPEGPVIGSSLIGQNFTQPQYFHGRPSAAGSGYDAANSSGSNLGPSAKALHEAVAARIGSLRQANPQAPAGPIPQDLVTASASGLDPHISPAAALWQAPRVAAARGRTLAEISALITAQTDGPFLSIFGAPRVNVLELNLALDVLPSQ